MTNKELPPQKLLLELFNYDKETGAITNKKHRANRARQGEAADRPYGNKPQRRIRMTINGKVESYFSHRIIWRMMTGDDLINDQIDHKDGDPSNNRWDNLRKATHSQNQLNKPMQGFTRCGNRWRVRISHKGARIDVGHYDCPLIAHLAYIDKANELHPEWVRK